VDDVNMKVADWQKVTQKDSKLASVCRGEIVHPGLNVEQQEMLRRWALSNPAAFLHAQRSGFGAFKPFSKVNSNTVSKSKEEDDDEDDDGEDDADDDEGMKSERKRRSYAADSTSQLHSQENKESLKAKRDSEGDRVCSPAEREEEEREEIRLDSDSNYSSTTRHGSPTAEHFSPSAVPERRKPTINHLSSSHSSNPTHGVLASLGSAARQTTAHSAAAVGLLGRSTAYAASTGLDHPAALLERGSTAASHDTTAAAVATAALNLSPHSLHGITPSSLPSHFPNTSALLQSALASGRGHQSLPFHPYASFLSPLTLQTLGLFPGSLSALKAAATSGGLHSEDLASPSPTPAPPPSSSLRLNVNINFNDTTRDFNEYFEKFKQSLRKDKPEDGEFPDHSPSTHHTHPLHTHPGLLSSSFSALSQLNEASSPLSAGIPGLAAFPYGDVSALSKSWSFERRKDNSVDKRAPFYFSGSARDYSETKRRRRPRYGSLPGGVDHTEMHRVHASSLPLNLKTERSESGESAVDDNKMGLGSARESSRQCYSTGKSARTREDKRETGTETGEEEEADESNLKEDEEGDEEEEEEVEVERAEEEGDEKEEEEEELGHSESFDSGHDRTDSDRRDLDSTFSLASSPADMTSPLSKPTSQFAHMTSHLHTSPFSSRLPGSVAASFSSPTHPSHHPHPHSADSHSHSSHPLLPLPYPHYPNPLQHAAFYPSYPSMTSLSASLPQTTSPGSLHVPNPATLPLPGSRASGFGLYGPGLMLSGMGVGLGVGVGGVHVGRGLGSLHKPPTVKKYKCDVCGSAFSRSNTLVTHKVR
jgi:hypothetical protein